MCCWTESLGSWYGKGDQSMWMFSKIFLIYISICRAKKKKKKRLISCSIFSNWHQRLRDVECSSECAISGRHGNTPMRTVSVYVLDPRDVVQDIFHRFYLSDVMDKPYRDFPWSWPTGRMEEHSMELYVHATQWMNGGWGRKCCTITFGAGLGTLPEPFHRSRFVLLLSNGVYNENKGDVLINRRVWRAARGYSATGWRATASLTRGVRVPGRILEEFCKLSLNHRVSLDHLWKLIVCTHGRIRWCLGGTPQSCYHRPQRHRQCKGTRWSPQLRQSRRRFLAENDFQNRAVWSYFHGMPRFHHAAG